MSATGIVAGGAVSRSSRYTLVATVGEPVRAPGAASSSRYQLQGGLNGAYGSLP